MHSDASYEPPPTPLREFFAHFKAGLDTRDKPWPADPHVLGGSHGLAQHLEEQLRRHDRVLEHAFVTAAWDFIRLERMSRNMYLDTEPHHDPDGWRRAALSGTVGAALALYDVYEPYAEQYLEDPAVALSKDALEFEGMSRRTR